MRVQTRTGDDVEDLRSAWRQQYDHVTFRGVNYSPAVARITQADRFVFISTCSHARPAGIAGPAILYPSPSPSLIPFEPSRKQYFIFVITCTRTLCPFTVYRGITFRGQINFSSMPVGCTVSSRLHLCTTSFPTPFPLLIFPVAVFFRVPSSS